MIFIGISSITFIIGAAPALVHHDYDFFLSRGRLVMTAVCILYVTAWWILAVTGTTVGGIATSALYHEGTPGRVQPDGKGLDTIGGVA